MSVQPVPHSPPQVLPHNDRPVVETWAELDQYIAGLIINAEGYIDEPELAQSVGIAGRERAYGRIAVCNNIRGAIAHLVEAEREERERDAGETSVEARYKAAGFTDLPPTIARLRDGDR